MRFPGFTDEWKKTTLGEITTNFNLRNKEQIDYPMFSVTNNRGFIPQSEQFEDREMKGEDIKAYKVIHHNDFAYNPARINVGSIAKYNGYEPCMISSLYVCFKANNEVNEDWLMHLLRTPKVQYYYQLNGEGGVRIYLFYPNFARIRTSIPSIEEQKKIAKILSIIDERIATQNKIIDNLQSLIKGLAKTFTHHGEPNSRISDCLECHTSTLQEGALNEDGKYLVYGASGVVGFLDDYRCDKDSILIIKDGSGAGTVSYATGEYSVIGTLNYLTAKSGYSLKYLYFCLMSFNFEQFKTGMAIPHIYFRDYGQAKIYCPSIEEQEHIAKALTIIENKLNIESRLLKSLYMEKQYLLNNMFR